MKFIECIRNKKAVVLTTAIILLSVQLYLYKKKYYPGYDYNMPFDIGLLFNIISWLLLSLVVSYVFFTLVPFSFEKKNYSYNKSKEKIIYHICISWKYSHLFLLILIIFITAAGRADLTGIVIAIPIALIFYLPIFLATLITSILSKKIKGTKIITFGIPVVLAITPGVLVIITGIKMLGMDGENNLVGQLSIGYGTLLSVITFFFMLRISYKVIKKNSGEIHE